MSPLFSVTENNSLWNMAWSSKAGLFSTSLLPLVFCLTTPLRVWLLWWGSWPNGLREVSLNSTSVGGRTPTSKASNKSSLVNQSSAGQFSREPNTHNLIFQSLPGLPRATSAYLWRMPYSLDTSHSTPLYCVRGVATSFLVGYFGILDCPAIVTAEWRSHFVSPFWNLRWIEMALMTPARQTGFTSSPMYRGMKENRDMILVLNVFGE